MNKYNIINQVENIPEGTIIPWPCENMNAQDPHLLPIPEKYLVWDGKEWKEIILKEDLEEQTNKI